MSLSSMRVALSMSLVLAAVAPFFAQATDDSVVARLEARDVLYVVDEDGDFKVTMSYPEGRTQLVFVSGGTERIGGLTVREVFAPAARVADGVDGDKALALMADSRENKIGSWELGGDVLYFVIKLPDDISAEQLETALNIAASAADDMELAFSGARDEL